MKCLKCSKENPDSAKFCIECGNTFQKNCKQCGFTLPNEAKFCLECGTAVGESKTVETSSLTGSRVIEQYIPKPLLEKMKNAAKTGGIQNERRIVTMLFCDLQGSTAAAEQLDPEEWADIMNGAFEFLIKPVYKYEGVIARLMGDAILAFFGAPIAHEDDPERGVLTGLEIINEIKPYLQNVEEKWQVKVDVRVGINTGLVVVGEMGSDMRVEYTAMGDAINLASRMESTAETGSLQITEYTYKIVEQLFETEELGPIRLKGKSKPILTYKVLRKKDQRVITRGLKGLDSPLVGRDQEFDTIIESVNHLFEGKGGILSVQAEAGLGKSRLIREIKKQLVLENKIEIDTNDFAEGQKLRWLEGTSLSYHTNTPYAPVKDLLDKILMLQSESNNSSKYKKMENILTGIGVPKDKICFFTNILDILPPDDQIHKIQYLDPPTLRSKTFGVFTQLIAQLSSLGPVTLVFDDIHWIDNSSLKLIKSIIPLVKTKKLLILLMFRPRRDERSWELHEFLQREYNHLYTTVNLKPLEQIESRFLVFNLLKIEGLSEKVRNLILSKSEGNPLFIEEVIRSMIDQKLIERDGEYWKEMQSIDDVAIPDTLSGVLTTRLDNLKDNQKYLLQIAAVIGREFSSNILVEILNHSDNIEETLHELQRKELIVEIGRTPHLMYMFRHPLTQESSYNSLLMKKRRELHNKIAQLIEKKTPEQYNEIAHHYYEAREYEHALPYLIKSGELAAKSYASNEAIEYFKKGESLISDTTSVELIHDLYNGLGQTYLFIGEPTESIHSYENLLDYAKQRNHLECEVNAHNRLGMVQLAGLGEIEKAVDHLNLAQDLAANANYKFGIAENYMIMCSVETASAQFENVVDHLQKVADIGEEFEDSTTQLYGRTHVSNTYYYMADFEKSINYAKKTVEIAFRLENKEFISELYSNSLAMSYLSIGNVEKAKEIAFEGYKLSSEIGLARNIFFASINIAEIAILQGDYETAQNYAAIGYEMSKQDPIPAFQILALSCNLFLKSELGEKEAVLEEINTTVNKIFEHKLGKFLATKYWIIDGLHHLQHKKSSKALKLFNYALEEVGTLMNIYKPYALIGKATVSLMENQLKEASELLDEAKEYMESKNVNLLKPQYGAAYARYLLKTDKIIEASELVKDLIEYSKSVNFRPSIIHLAHLQYEIAEQLKDKALSSRSLELFTFTKESIVKQLSDPITKNRYTDHIEMIFPFN